MHTMHKPDMKDTTEIVSHLKLLNEGSYISSLSCAHEGKYLVIGINNGDIQVLCSIYFSNNKIEELIDLMDIEYKRLTQFNDNITEHIDKVKDWYKEHLKHFIKPRNKLAHPEVTYYSGNYNSRSLATIAVSTQ